MRAPFFVFAAALSLSQVAAAEVLVSNLAQPTRDTSVLSDQLWAAQSFFNDGVSHTLTSIRTVVGGAAGNPAIFAELRDGSVTGTVLTTFSLPSFTGAFTARNFMPLSSVTLNPDGKYFFILGLAGGSVGWSYAEGNGQVGPGVMGNFEYSENQGASWADFGFDNPYLMEVNVGSTVPEPAIWTLMILGLGMAGGALRRHAPATA